MLQLIHRLCRWFLVQDSLLADLAFPVPANKRRREGLSDRNLVEWISYADNRLRGQHLHSRLLRELRQ